MAVAPSVEPFPHEKHLVLSRVILALVLIGASVAVMLLGISPSVVPVAVGIVAGIVAICEELAGEYKTANRWLLLIVVAAVGVVALVADAYLA